MFGLLIIGGLVIILNYLELLPGAASNAGAPPAAPGSGWQPRPLAEVERLLARGNEWVKVIPNNREASIRELSPARISGTITDQQSNLDAVLISAIGLADIGSDVVGANRQPLTDALHLLVPTTDLTNQYNAALTCGIGGLIPLATGPGAPVPGAVLLQSFMLGRERYRYPGNLPKVAAKGGPQCTDLPNVHPEQKRGLLCLMQALLGSEDDDLLLE
jgi:hypothetical protein